VRSWKFPLVEDAVKEPENGWATHSSWLPQVNKMGRYMVPATSLTQFRGIGWRLY
jgi:hypothetical protein